MPPRYLDSLPRSSVQAPPLDRMRAALRSTSRPYCRRDTIAGSYVPSRQGGALSQGYVGVLTVDDQAVFRRVARDVIDATAGFESVGEASSGEEAVAIADQVHPELVLMDVRMEGMDGCEAARRIRAAHPDTTIVLITVQDLDDVPVSAQACGAVELVRKQDFCPGMLQELWRRHRRSDAAKTQV
jgi:two-component system, NarL family, invasion response regulator UvrY